MRFGQKTSTGFLQLVHREIVLLFLTIIVAGAASAQVCTAPPPGLVAWWPGDGNYLDIIGHDDGTPLGTVTFLPGEVGQAFSFNSSSVHVPNSSAIDLTGDLTVEAWIKPASSTRGFIVVKGNGDDFTNAFALRYGDGSDQRLLLSVADGGTGASYFETVPGAVPVGVFSHVAAVIQGATAAIYVNGVEVTGQYLHLANRGGSTQPATQLTSNRFSDHGAFWIGTNSDVFDNAIPFNGLIDEVSVYSRALSSAEIGVIFGAGTAGKCKSRGGTISPDHGGNAGSTTFRVAGSAFQEGVEVKLSGSGANIVATNTTVLDPQNIVGTFNLVGAVPGVRNVVVTNLDGTSVTIPDGFTVEQGGAPQLWVNVLGRDKTKIGGAQTFYISYGNRGNVDSGRTIVTLSFPADVQFKIGTGNTSNQIISAGSSNGQNSVAVLFQTVAAGSSGSVVVSLTATTQQVFTMTASVRQQ